MTASPLASVYAEEIFSMNEEAIPENTNRTASTEFNVKSINLSNIKF